ncbi:MAG: hypothetical protein LDLANPLL_01197 [Turneriella sp.]|nr:hypothetical protein [Turneriella sp.]
MQRRARTAVLVAAIFSSLFFSVGYCSSTPNKGVVKDSTQELNSLEREDFQKKISHNYLPYKSLSVAFTLKGKIGGEEIFYEGELTSQQDSLKIQLKDAVFLSPLLTLTIGKDTVTLNDHARAKLEKIPRAEYRWVNLFGRLYPIHFFEPLMRGFLPVEVSLDSSSFTKTAAGEILVRTDNDSFEAALYFKEAALKKIFYRDKSKGEILVFQLGNPFKVRLYPQSLRIEHTSQNDSITLLFKNLRVKGTKKIPNS